MIDLDLGRIVPSPSKSLRDGAIAPWTTPAYRGWLQDLLDLAPALGIPADVPFKRLTPEQVRAIVEGSPAHGFPGLRGFFRWLEKKSYKMHVRVFLSRWRGYSPCPDCHGARLRPEALAVQVGGLDIASLSAMKIGEARAFLAGLDPVAATNPVARRILEQVRGRLDYLDRIGLDYLTLDRPARTLSGGEARRVALTSALGSGLVNTLYVLDEPSIGLHPRDVGRLIAALRGLRDAGNSVVVVEHDLEVIRAADLLVDIGPGAGEGGGRLLYVGPPEGIARGRGLGHRRRSSPAVDAVAVPDADATADRGQLLADRRAGPQPQESRRRLPAGRPLRRHGRQRLGQEHARRGDALPRAPAPARPRSRCPPPLTRADRHGRHRRRGARRPVADRPFGRDRTR